MYAAVYNRSGAGGLAEETAGIGTEVDITYELKHIQTVAPCREVCVRHGHCGLLVAENHSWQA